MTKPKQKNKNPDSIEVLSQHFGFRMENKVAQNNPLKPTTQLSWKCRHGPCDKRFSRKFNAEKHEKICNVHIWKCLNHPELCASEHKPVPVKTGVWRVACPCTIKPGVFWYKSNNIEGAKCSQAAIFPTSMLPTKKKVKLVAKFEPPKKSDDISSKQESKIAVGTPFQETNVPHEESKKNSTEVEDDLKLSFCMFLSTLQTGS
jgi:hypothetical protein